MPVIVDTHHFDSAYRLHCLPAGVTYRGARSPNALAIKPLIKFLQKAHKMWRWLQFTKAHSGKWREHSRNAVVVVCIASLTIVTWLHCFSKLQYHNQSPPLGTRNTGPLADDHYFSRQLQSLIGYFRSIILHSKTSLHNFDFDCMI